MCSFDMFFFDDFRFDLRFDTDFSAALARADFCEASGFCALARADAAPPPVDSFDAAGSAGVLFAQPITDTG